MRPEIQIQTAIEAMTDVVIPALDPGDALAQEQAQLVVGMLSLLGRFLALEFRFDRDELTRLAATAEAVRGSAQGGPQTAAALERLASGVAGAGDVLDRARAEPGELRAAVAELRTAVGELVSAVYQDGEPEGREAVQRAVLALSTEQGLRERSAMLLQGWEGEGHGVPELEELLADRAPGAP